MTHFATPDGEFSPAEAELASVLDSDSALLDGFAPLGLALIASELTFSIILLTIAAGLDIDEWWAQ